VAIFFIGMIGFVLDRLVAGVAGVVTRGTAAS
jgi:nitrate/nitrite transport system permease protein